MSLLREKTLYIQEDLGWVDFDLGSFPGWWAATVATYCPSRVLEHPKSRSTKLQNPVYEDMGRPVQCSVSFIYPEQKL